MSRYLIYIQIVSSCLLLYAGCSIEKQKEKHFEYSADKFIVIDSIVLPFNTDTVFTIKTIKSNDEWCYFLSKNNNLYLWNTATNNVKTIPLKCDFKISDVYVKNYSEIYCLTDNQIIITDTCGQISNTINLDSSKWYYSASNLFPFYVIDTLVFIFKYPKFVIHSLEDYKKFISSNREFCFDLKNKREMLFNYELGKYPKELNHHFKYVFNPFRIIDNKSNIIYSFECNDTIEIYNLLTKQLSRKVIKSNYFVENSDFNFSNINHYDLISRYLIENSRYYNLLYNEYKNTYYRIVLHKYNYQDGDKINLRTDVPWSLILCDEHFNVLKEVVFEPQQYDFSKCIITKKGVLIKKQIYENVYTLFDFNSVSDLL